MNILFVTVNKVSNNFKGGIEKITSILMETFKKHGINCYSIYNVDNNYTPTLQQEKNYKIDFKDINSLQKLESIIIDNKIDFIINQHNNEAIELLWRLKQKMGKIKLIYCLHMSPYSIYNPTKFYFLYNDFFNDISIKKISKLIAYPLFNIYIHKKQKKLLNSIYYKNDAIILLSKYYIEEFIKIIKQKDFSKIEAINNCLTYTNTFNIANYKNKENKIIVVARFLDSHKNISEIIKIWFLVEKNILNLNWTLEIIGEGPDKYKYLDLIKKLNIKNIIIKEVEDPLPYYQKASIFLMTSKVEGFPLTLNEAKQNGVVPIVYNSFKAATEMIDNGKDGFLIKNNNKKDFYQKLVLLMLDKNLRENMALNAIRNAKKYDPENIYSDWLNIFNRISNKD